MPDNTERSEHRKIFAGRDYAVCSCGFTAHRTPGGAGANRNLIRHLLHPSAANRIAPTAAEHAGCTIESWVGRWSVCTDHNVYIDNQAEPVDGQTEMSFT